MLFVGMLAFSIGSRATCAEICLSSAIPESISAGIGDFRGGERGLPDREFLHGGHLHIDFLSPSLRYPVSVIPAQGKSKWPWQIEQSALSRSSLSQLLHLNISLVNLEA